MKILSFFKNIFKEESPPEIEEIEFNELENWIKNKESTDEKESENISNFLKEKISILINSLSEDKEVLKNIDLSEKKIEERAKFIVKQNLDYYITHLEKLITDLSDIEINDPNDFVKKIDEVFINFNKKSEMNFQKATILIGKELGQIKDCMNIFFKDIKKHLDENKNFLKTKETILLIKNNLNKINELEQTNNKLNKELENHTKKINNLEDQIKENLESINKIKESKNYKEELAQKQKEINQNQDLEKEFSNLKESIDFKSLTSIFHANEKEMNLIKEYQNNFKETFEKNNQDVLIDLLESAKVNNSQIQEKIVKIKEELNKSKEITNKKEPKQTKTISLKESEVKKLKQEIHDLEYELSRRKRKTEKITDDKSEIINNIKLKMSRIDIQVN